jgi:hypothetical protein
MTVFNRSNDLIWGSLGANVVHFSFLQEYMACALDCRVGLYHQVSNNLHVYEANWKPEKWMRDTTADYARDREDQAVQGGVLPSPLKLVRDREQFDHEVKSFINDFKQPWSESFLLNIAQPMMWAFECHKERNYGGAYLLLDKVRAEDWREAGLNWIRKREKNWKRKSEAQQQLAQSEE